CSRCHSPYLLYTQSPYTFFFQSYADHRDLHSFPTRRSSDLRNARRPVTARPAARPVAEHASGHAHVGVGTHFPLLGANTKGYLRSEEHTSELQSRENLVCRLLLEKKKNEIQNDNSFMNLINI